MITLLLLLHADAHEVHVHDEHEEERDDGQHSALAQDSRKIMVSNFSFCRKMMACSWKIFCCVVVDEASPAATPIAGSARPRDATGGEPQTGLQHACRSVQKPDEHF